MHVVLDNPEIMNGGSFDLSYDLIVLDESDSLLSRFDEGAINKTDVEIWAISTKILQHSKRLVLMTAMYHK